MSGDLTIPIRRFEPTDQAAWEAASVSQRRAWYGFVARAAMAALKTRFLEGKDRFGKTLRPRLHERDDGANGPPLVPHEARSRSITLMRERHSSKEALIYWDGGWGKILACHAEGIPSRLGAVRRDMGGFTDKERDSIRRQASEQWKKTLSRAQPALAAAAAPIAQAPKTSKSSKAKPAAAPAPAPAPAPGSAEHIPHLIAAARQEIDAAIAKQRKANAKWAKSGSILYEEALAVSPNTLPRHFAVEKRLEIYKPVADLKIAKIKELHQAFESRRALLQAEADEAAAAKAIAMKQFLSFPNGDPRRAALLPEVRQKTQAQQAAAELVARIDEERRQRLKELLAAAEPTRIALPDLKPGSSGPADLSPLSAASRARADRAAEWLGAITQRGDSDALSVPTGEKSGARAHYALGPHYIQLGDQDSEAIAVHELGHAIEENHKTGRQKGVIHSANFLAMRTQGEALTDIGDKFGVDAMRGEMGRKDQFDRAFPEQSAYYVGKDYGGGKATEILSMGLQRLYEDPAAFVDQDPEYASYVLGYLDGSIR